MASSGRLRDPTIVAASPFPNEPGLLQTPFPPATAPHKPRQHLGRRDRFIGAQKCLRFELFLDRIAHHHPAQRSPACHCEKLSQFSLRAKNAVGGCPKVFLNIAENADWLA